MSSNLIHSETNTNLNTSAYPSADPSLRKVMMHKVNRVLDNLKRNNMNGYYVETLDELKALVTTLVPPKSSIAVGGSQTLTETGMLQWIRENDFQFYDRYAPGLSADDLKQIHRKAFTVDAYFCSSNAITENGELYNVDGSGNRVAAMIYGPDRVIVIAGINKIVKDIDDAIRRNREIAAPTNCVRLNMSTPCAVTGSCADCKTPARICCAYSTIGFQRNKDRMHVILVDGYFGY